MRSGIDSRIQTACRTLRVTPRELASKSDTQLAGLHNFGKKTIARIRDLYPETTRGDDLQKALFLFSDRDLEIELRRRRSAQ